MNMTERELPVTEEELHAYIDGELAAVRHAAVEAWLEAHPDDAARVATWRAQVDAIRAKYGPVASERVPPRLNVDQLAVHPERRWKRIAAAAAVLAFLVGGGAGWVGHILFRQSGQVMTTEAVDAHRLYVVEVRHPVEVPGSESDHLAQWLSRRVGYAVEAPDLDRIGLKLVGGRLLPSLTGNGAAFFMYEGASGERFTIYCRRTRAKESAFRYDAAGPVGSFTWVADTVGYVVSGPADRARLQTVAQAVYQRIDTHQSALPSNMLSDARD
jgi:anti-sigma factor RsiW